MIKFVLLFLENDIDAILHIIQAQQKTQSSSESSSSERYALRSKLINLLQHSLNLDNQNDEKKSRQSIFYEFDSNENDKEHNRLLVQNKGDDSGYTYVDKKKIRPFILLSKMNEEKRKNREVRPNTLLEPYEGGHDSKSLSEYSKIYVILNPDIMKSSHNKKKLADLFSRLMTSKASNSQNIDDLQYGSRLSQSRFRRDYFDDKVALVPINEIYGSPRINLDDLMEILSANQGRGSETSSESFGSSDDNDDHHQKYDKTLRGGKLLNFLQKSVDDKNIKLKETNQITQLYSHLNKLNNKRQNKYLVNNKYDIDNNKKKNSNQVDRFVQYLLTKIDNSQDNALEKEAVTMKNREEGEKDLDDYSRIYVILNPEALESSLNQKKLSALISRLMSKSSMPQSRVQSAKGYPTKAIFARRRRRDSYEGMRDSMEDTRPKRQRYSYGGGGGGSGGRTAIPYIRHRGDIYERDH